MNPGEIMYPGTQPDDTPFPGPVVDPPVRLRLFDHSGKLLGSGDGKFFAYQIADPRQGYWRWTRRYKTVQQRDRAMECRVKGRDKPTVRKLDICADGAWGNLEYSNHTQAWHAKRQAEKKQ